MNWRIFANKHLVNLFRQEQMSFVKHSISRQAISNFNSVLPCLLHQLVCLYAFFSRSSSVFFPFSSSSAFELPVLFCFIATSNWQMTIVDELWDNVEFKAVGDFLLILTSQFYFFAIIILNHQGHRFSSSHR
jgi:hypothetical protein